MRLVRILPSPLRYVGHIGSESGVRRTHMLGATTLTYDGISTYLTRFIIRWRSYAMSDGNNTRIWTIP